MKNLFLGIDLGTSTMKLVLIDENKNIVSQRTEYYQVASLNNGWSEINPDIWFDCMKNGIKKIFADIDSRLVKSIGITGQMHTLVIIDENGLPVRSAIMWNDTRTKALIPELKEMIKYFEEGTYLSRTISTGSPAANLYWLKQNEPDSFKKINRFMIGPDYLVYKLTGKCSTDYCEASTSCLYLLRAEKWSHEMQQLIGLRDEMYPEIKGSAEIVDFVLPSVAQDLGLSEKVSVLAGTGDNPATMISTGCLGGSYPVMSLGTSGVLMMPVKEISDEIKGKVILFSFNGQHVSYLVQGAVQSNGSTLDWWFKKIMEKEDFSEIDKILSLDKAVHNELIFYPHLMGDKTIYADPNIRGAFIGLSIETHREDMLYALIEGLCFAFKELAEAMNFSFDKEVGLKVLGGGSKSKVWMQTLSNVFDMKVEQMDGMMGPCFGIALLAAYQSGYIDSVEHIAKNTIKIKQCFSPEEKYKALYSEKYKKYLRIHKGLNYIYNG